MTIDDGSGGSHDNGHLDCTAQDQEFQRIFLIGYSLGMVLSFPLGLCLDRLGSVPTRLMAGLVYTLGQSAKMFARTIKNLESAASAQLSILDILTLWLRLDSVSMLSSGRVLYLCLDVTFNLWFHYAYFKL